MRNTKLTPGHTSDIFPRFPRGFGMPSKKSLQSLQKRVHTDKRIATILRVSITTVYRWRKEYGILSNRVKNEKRNAEIKKRSKNKYWSFERLAKKYGLSKRTIYKIVNGK